MLDKTHRKKNRTPLACLRCRIKRERCSGDRPQCKICVESGSDCEWPAGRRPRRTKAQLAADAAREANESSPPIEVAPRFSPVEPFPILRNFSSDSWAPRAAYKQPEFSYSTDNRAPFSIANYSRPSTATSIGTSSHSMTPSPFTVSPPTSDNESFWRGTVDQIYPPAVFHEGNKTLEATYHRYEGITARGKTGLRRIPVQFEEESAENLHFSSKNYTPLFKDPSNAYFDFNDNKPSPHVYLPLVELFFKHTSQFFPSFTRRRLEERLQTGTMSALVLNAICAVSVRFVEAPTDTVANLCAPFASRAATAAMPILQFPTPDSILGVALLAWANYGSNLESGCWQFSGIAFRMSSDLGLHTLEPLCESDEQYTRTHLLFWALYIFDRIISFGYGRNCMVSDRAVCAPLPGDADLFPLASATHAQAAMAEVSASPTPSPFVQLAKLFVTVGRISDYTNGRHGTRPLTDRPLAGCLQDLQIEIVKFCRLLPAELTWSTETLKEMHANGQSGVYLTLHLWMNAMLAFVYDPSQQCSHCLAPSERNSMDSKTALLSARAVSDASVVAALMADGAIASSPQIVQPLAIASRVLFNEVQRIDKGQFSSATPSLCRSILVQDLINLHETLMTVERKWAGCGYLRVEVGEQLLSIGVNVLVFPSASSSIPMNDVAIRRRYSGESKFPNTRSFRPAGTYENIEGLLQRYTTPGSTMSSTSLMNYASI